MQTWHCLNVGIHATIIIIYVSLAYEEQVHNYMRSSLIPLGFNSELHITYYLMRINGIKNNIVDNLKV